MPKISICVPAYQNPAGVARLLSSVREQTFSDYEVVLTDDSGDDGVKKAALASGVQNLHYHKNGVRLGATGNCWPSVGHGRYPCRRMEARLRGSRGRAGQTPQGRRPRTEDKNPSRLPFPDGLPLTGLP